MAGTYCFWELNQEHHLPYWTSLVAGMALSALIGVLMQVAIMRPLRNASALTRLIATLAVLLVLDAIASLRYPEDLITVPSALPITSWPALGGRIGWDKTWIFVLVVAIVAALGLIYRYTRFGRATSAVSQNPLAASGLGYSPGFISAANWGIGGALAALAGILLAPIAGLQVLTFTLLVMPAIAAALVGSMSSFTLTLAGGLMIGVLQSEATRYASSVQGLSDSIPFLLVIVILLVRGRALPLRSFVAERLPSVGTGRIRLSLAVPAVAIVAVLFGVLSVNWVDALTTTCGTAIIVLSLVVLTGYAGQISLAQASFAGIGAFTAGHLVATEGLAFQWAFLVAVAVAVPLGVLFSMISLRVRGVSLAIATLGLAVAANALLFANSNLTGPASNIGATKLFGLDIDGIAHPQRYGWFTLAVLTIAMLCVANVRRGRVGRRLLAVRANERAAASMGISVSGAKVYAFVVASALAAAGGVVLAFRSSTIVFTGYDLFQSINYISIGVVGGIGWIMGAGLAGTMQGGALATMILDEISSGWDIYVPLITAILLILTILKAREGLVPLNVRLLLRLRPLRHRLGGRAEWAPAGADAAPEVHRVTPMELRAERISVRFGGVVALDDVSVTVAPGQVVGLIGPNGAGKTTFIDAITGFVSASGRVTLGDRPIDRASAVRRARAGLGRSFQSLELFEDLSVLDNLRCAADPRDRLSYLKDMVVPRSPALTAATQAAIKEFQLGECLETVPTELSYGQRHMVAIARAVAGAASVLLLDEPAAGLDDEQRSELRRLILQLAAEWGMAVLLIDHDVDLVMSACDYLYVLNFGKVISQGAPEEVLSDPKVKKAYLGITESSVESNGYPESGQTVALQSGLTREHS
jgi:sulfate-transporting ATPase